MFGCAQSVPMPRSKYAAFSTGFFKGYRIFRGKRRGSHRGCCVRDCPCYKRRADVFCSRICRFACGVDVSGVSPYANCRSRRLSSGTLKQSLEDELHGPTMNYWLKNPEGSSFSFHTIERRADSFSGDLRSCASALGSLCGRSLEGFRACTHGQRYG